MTDLWTRTCTNRTWHACTSECFVPVKGPVYTIDSCEHDEGNHPNSHRFGGHFVGRISERLPMCSGSRLVEVGEETT